MQPLTLAAIGIALVGFVAISILNNARRPKKSEAEHQLPGPRLFPIIGRIHDMPIQKMWIKFKEFADIHGPIYYTEMLGTSFIIVSDEKIAEELLVKKAKYNSDRPAVPSLFDSKSTHGSMEYLPLMGKNQYWARQRRFSHGYLTQATNAGYYGVMQHEVKRWMFRLLENPDAFNYTLEDMASKIMCTLNWDDPSLSEYCITSAWGLLTQMSPAGPITNIITPLWKLPEAINPWKKAEHKRHDEQQRWWMENLIRVKKQMKAGTARWSFTKQFLETEKTNNLSGDYEASSVLGMLALVGIFTVAGPLNYFLVAMVHHPEWQKKLQNEIDEQLEGRMPSIEDFPKLPILRACIKESMRWRPNVPTGVAHEAEQDDYYRGYFIPKGVRILPLDYAFLLNPVKYPDPESYRPERWLEAGWPTFQEPLTQHPNIKGMTSFGFGQRQCLGMSLTQDELIVACGALAWAFNLKRKVDPATGREIEVPTDKCNSLLIVKPDPFEMAFEPRSEARKADVIREWKITEAKDNEERAAYAKAAALGETKKFDDIVI
ncbi:cytochrome P450 [Aureobasidium namibiae CBS 147.97]|uniref:Cytochrome P450 n=1 Tax=Aureobasidium namibiae CBS 147.97 TaxID=1043004 RepID=A0A074WKC2_9PEZI